MHIGEFTRLPVAVFSPEYFRHIGPISHESRFSFDVRVCEAYLF